MTWRCAKCDTALERNESNSVADSDGISADAIVTTWRCPACAATFTHWYIQRAGFDDGKIVDAGREHWSPEEPAFAFDPPWHALSDPTNCEAELAREVSRGHVLHGRHVRALARHEACDDVLFVTDDGAVWVVHLTWTRHEEKDPRWPTTTRYRSLAQFADNHETD